jgi:sporulation protein YlmC with PRC-barrel domain
MIRASDLIGCELRSESGAKLGRVHDLRAEEADGGWRLVGLVAGRGGLLARLGAGSGDEAVTKGDVVPWEKVTRLEEGRVTVRD